jgi:RNA polymerase sigma-70 factor (ECF subfamily)
MKRAWVMFKMSKHKTFSEALKASWLIEKNNVVTYNINTLYKKYNNELLNYVAFKINGNKFDSQDIVSEVFVKVNQNIYLFDSSKSSLRTWLYNITNNCIIDYVRSKKATKRNIEKTTYISEFQKDNGEDWLQPTNPDAINQLENNELASSIAKAMETLKPIEKQLANLILMQGYKYQEVSDMLNINLNIVKVTINRIKSKLAIELKQVYELHQ